MRVLKITYMYVYIQYSTYTHSDVRYIRGEYIFYGVHGKCYQILLKLNCTYMDGERISHYNGHAWTRSSEVNWSYANQNYVTLKPLGRNSLVNLSRWPPDVAHTSPLRRDDVTLLKSFRNQNNRCQREIELNILREKKLRGDPCIQCCVNIKRCYWAGGACNGQMSCKFPPFQLSTQIAGCHALKGGIIFWFRFLPLFVIVAKLENCGCDPCLQHEVQCFPERKQETKHQKVNRNIR